MKVTVWSRLVYNCVRQRRILLVCLFVSKRHILRLIAAGFDTDGIAADMEQILLEGDGIAVHGVILLVERLPTAVEIQTGDFGQVFCAFLAGKGQFYVLALLIVGNSGVTASPRADSELF